MYYKRFKQTVRRTTITLLLLLGALAPQAAAGEHKQLKIEICRDKQPPKGKRGQPRTMWAADPPKTRFFDQVYHAEKGRLCVAIPDPTTVMRYGSSNCLYTIGKGMEVTGQRRFLNPSDLGSLSFAPWKPRVGIVFEFHSEESPFRPTSVTVRSCRALNDGNLTVPKTKIKRRTIEDGELNQLVQITRGLANHRAELTLTRAQVDNLSSMDRHVQTATIAREVSILVNETATLLAQQQGLPFLFRNFQQISANSAPQAPWVDVKNTGHEKLNIPAYGNISAPLRLLDAFFNALILGEFLRGNIPDVNAEHLKQMAAAINSATAQSTLSPQTQTTPFIKKKNRPLAMPRQKHGGRPNPGRLSAQVEKAMASESDLRAATESALNCYVEEWIAEPGTASAPRVFGLLIAGGLNRNAKKYGQAQEKVLQAMQQRIENGHSTLIDNVARDVQMITGCEIVLEPTKNNDAFVARLVRSDNTRHNKPLISGEAAPSKALAHLALFRRIAATKRIVARNDKQDTRSAPHRPAYKTAKTTKTTEPPIDRLKKFCETKGVEPKLSVIQSKKKGKKKRADPRAFVVSGRVVYEGQPYEVTGNGPNKQAALNNAAAALFDTLTRQ